MKALTDGDERERVYDNYALSTGRTFNANNGFIGLNEHGAVSGGYDDQILYSLSDTDWTAAERRELAEFMITRWQEWRDRQPTA